MKRFWLVLLALGLVMAFSASVFAADVKFSGSYYAAGMYQDNTKFVKGTSADGPSTAFYYQRLRVNMEFIATPALKLVTRFDAMERVWGAARSASVGSANTTTGAISSASSDFQSSGTTAENQNIAFDLMYIQYATKIGLFRVGYQDDGAWATVFADSTTPLAKVQYIGQFGPVTAIAYFGKFVDNSYTRINAATAVDRDIDMYAAAVVYSFKADKVSGDTGILWKWYSSAVPRAYTASAFTQDVHVILPYARVKVGPVLVQAELVYGFGDYMNFESNAIQDVDLSNWAGWIDATADFGMFYVGGSFAYIAGDDASTADEKEGGFVTGGTDWNPCLIMFNFDRYYWAGQIPGYAATVNPNNTDNPFLASNNGGMTNAWFGTVRAGVRPIADLDIMASVSYAKADEVAAGWDDEYGWEIDVTATYKITNNLSYMLGGGYMFVGDYFKAGTAGELDDNFLIINKLTLTF